MAVRFSATTKLPSQQSLIVRSISIISAIWISSITFVVCVQADSTQPDAFNNPLISVLEGKSFSGQLGGPDIAPGSTDIIEFQDGRFISKECQKRCGYTDGPYWVRSDGDAVQFKAETPCLEANATIVWNGTVKDSEVEGTFTWTSERWYWTVEKEFSFKGKLIKSEATATE